MDSPTPSALSVVLPSGAHASLRAATADDHAGVDAAFGRYALDDAGDYARFLAAHAAVVLPLERALDDADFAARCADWTTRRRAALLRADRAELPATGDDLPDASLPPLDTPAALWGAAYVLEGSRLGGRVLARRLQGSFPRRYLDAGARDWRGFVQALDAALPAASAQAAAIAAATAVFSQFAAAGRAALQARDHV